jgi:hypothetical protein
VAHLIYLSISQHPQVFIPLRETRFFLYDPEEYNSGAYQGPTIHIRSLSEYEALFEGVTNEKAVGEKTPFYLYYESAIDNIQRTLPDVKLIFSLRNPVDRAYSIYWLGAREGKKRLPVDEALTPTSHFVTGGFYYTALSKWYARFDRSQIKVVLVDDLKKSTQLVFEDICDYLNVNSKFEIPDPIPKNPGGKPKNRVIAKSFYSIRHNSIYKSVKPMIPKNLIDKVNQYRSDNIQKPPPIDPKLAERLRSYYQDDIVQLEELIDRDLSAWKSG